MRDVPDVSPLVHDLTDLINGEVHLEEGDEESGRFQR
jgi:hypothetical protein